MTTRVDEVADELYGLPPAEFIAARDRRAREATAGGDREAAASIRKLRRPSTSAWLTNMLNRRMPDQLAELTELGEALRGAQATLAGDELRRLTEDRRRLVDRLTGSARSLAAELGNPASESVLREVETTLQTALVDQQAAATVAAGRVTSVLQPDTATMFSSSLAAAAPTAAVSEAPPADLQLARARKHHQKAVRALQDAEQDAAERRRVHTTAQQRLAQATAHRDELASALREAEQELTEAERTLDTATEKSAVADQTVAEARATARQAKEDLDNATR